MILLLLITISVVGVAMIFFQRTAQTATESGEELLKGQISYISTNFRIDGVSGDKIYIRNMGGSAIKQDSMSLYVDGKRADTMPLSQDIGVGELAQIELNPGCPPPTPFEVPAGEHDIKLVSGGREENLKGSIQTFSNMCGDAKADCGIDITDSLFTAQFVGGTRSYVECTPFPDCADVDGNGEVESCGSGMCDSLFIATCVSGADPGIKISCPCLAAGTCVAPAYGRSVPPNCQYP